MLLDRFRTVKAEEVRRLAEQRQAGTFPAPWSGKRAPFGATLARTCATSRASGGLPLALIAEYKRASPSKGRICETVSPEEAVLAYAKGGAAAISVLTEEKFFEGCTEYLHKGKLALAAAELATPLLRKDFIMDPLQVEATAATPASALLLIVRLTPDPKDLRTLREQAESYGIDAVVEVFDKADLELARESGARIIQVNARDLETFHVDRQAGLDLIRDCPPLGEEVWIAASGVSEGVHLVEAAKAGFTAALVGTALMKDGRPGEAVSKLLAEAAEAFASGK